MFLVDTGFDFKDTPDGFPSLSPRNKSPKKRISDLSVSSLSDAFSPDTPASRPGPPQSRMSDLSMISISSVSSAFSVVSLCVILAFPGIHELVRCVVVVLDFRCMESWNRIKPFFVKTFFHLLSLTLVISSFSPFFGEFNIDFNFILKSHKILSVLDKAD